MQKEMFYQQSDERKRWVRFLRLKYQTYISSAMQLYKLMCMMYAYAYMIYTYMHVYIYIITCIYIIKYNHILLKFEAFRPRVKIKLAVLNGFDQRWVCGRIGYTRWLIFIFPNNFPDDNCNLWGYTLW